jgi:hypothetical protein
LDYNHGEIIITIFRLRNPNTCFSGVELWQRPPTSLYFFVKSNRQKLTAWLLRATGALEILAFGAVIMPRAWMEASHAWLGLGVMPGGPITMFMIRQASYFYGMHGVLLWLMARDVIRFRPLVRFTGIMFLLAAPVFFVIDYTSGMPVFWTLSDLLSSVFIGAALLWLTKSGFELDKQA